MTRKEIIVQAATELFIEKGYRETTTSDIRKKAGVAQGTLFYHFQNKEGILLYIFSEVIASYTEAVKSFEHQNLRGIDAIVQYTELCNELRKEKGSNLWFILPNFVPSLLQQNLETRKLFYQFFNTSIELIEGFIKRGIDDGSIRDIDATKTAHLIFALFIGINRHMSLPEKEGPDLSYLTIDFIKTALATGK